MKLKLRRPDILKCLRKVLVVIRFTLFSLLISSAFAFSINSYSQNTNLSLHLSNASVGEVLKAIEDQSEFIFFYQDQQLDIDRQVEIVAVNKPVSETLDQLFKGSDNVYTINDRQVVIGKAQKQSEIKGIPIEKTFHEFIQPLRKALKGKVTDEKGSPIPGATIIVEEFNVGTITDADGVFTLDVPVEAKTLTISFIGYKTQKVPIGDKMDFSIQLAEEIVGLDEIVVVGYGTQKKVSTVASISQIQGDVLEKVGGVTNITEQLQGLLPGVTVINNSSKPGYANSEIFIRGQASWVSNSILSLVDGVERDFNDVSPDEIETISVLKDASATSVYGVKGANGVILITTKRGTLKKPEISFEMNQGWKDIITTPEFTDYVTSMKMWNEASTNDMQWQKLIPQSTIDAWSNAIDQGIEGPYNPYFPQVDWWKEILQTGTSQKYNMSIRGGTDFVKYFTSIGYLNDGDIFTQRKNDLFDSSNGYKRYNWRNNFDFQLTKTSLLSVNLSGFYGFRNQTGSYISSEFNPNNVGDGGFYSNIYDASRNVFPIMYDDGLYGVSPSGGGNLISQFDLGQRIYKTSKTYIDVNFQQKLDFITKGLNFHTKLSYNIESGTLTSIQKYDEINFGASPSVAIGMYRDYDYSTPLPDGGYALISSQRWPATFQGTNPAASYDLIMQGGYQKRLLYEFGFDYSKSIKDHNITLMALMNRIEDSGLNNGSRTAVQFPVHAESWVGRFTYNWNERYLVELNGAYTGSQKFAPGKRFGFFPSFALGWRLSEEPLLKELIGTDVINNLKVRYSSGVIGYDQSAPAYAYIQIYNNKGGGVAFGDFSKYNYGPLYGEGAAANVNATWETAYKQNLGFEIGIIRKLNVTLDLFKEKREGILMSVATPGWFGISEPTGNIGSTKNHGYEIELAWRDKIGKSVNYWFKANTTFSENRIVYRNDPRNRAEYLKYAGKPIGVQDKLIVAGFYNSLDDIYNGATANNITNQNRLVPGDFMYVDYNADGLIQDTDDQVPMKELRYPLTTFGFSGGANYKGFALSLVFYGVGNLSKEVDGRILWDLLQGNAGVYSTNTDVFKTWTPENALTASKPVLHSDYKGYSSRAGTTYSYQAANYIRLKNVEISYAFGKGRILNDLRISKLQLYANGNNLLTFTKFNKNVDPEQDGTRVYPIVKNYTIGLRLSF